MKGLTKSFGIVEVSHLQFMDNNIFFCLRIGGSFHKLIFTLMSFLVIRGQIWVCHVSSSNYG